MPSMPVINAETNIVISMFITFLRVFIVSAIMKNRARYSIVLKKREPMLMLMYCVVNKEVIMLMSISRRNGILILRETCCELYTEIKTIKKKARAIKLTIIAENKGSGVFKLTSICREEIVEIMTIKSGTRRTKLITVTVKRAGEVFNLIPDNLRLRAFFTSHARIAKVAQTSTTLFEEGMKKTIA